MLEKDDIILERLTDKEENYKLLEKWYQLEEIYSSFEQRILTYEEIKNKYYHRTLESTNVPVYIIKYKNKKIGIIQYQLVTNENKELYSISGNNIYEIDIFIGEINLHNKGIGKKAILLLADYLFKEIDANKILMCPLITNKKAIKCYENCGFKIENTFKTKDTIGNLKEYVLMVR